MKRTPAQYTDHGITAVKQRLGSIIRSRRLEMGYSQSELGELSGIDKAYIGRLERGERQPTVVVLLRVLKALNLDVGLILAELDEILGDKK